MAHTPGPWGFFPDFDPEFEDPKYVVDVPAERAPHRLSDAPWSYIQVAAIENQTSDENGNETESNARLIAAAPDLLEKAHAMLDAMDGSYAQVAYAAGQLKAAIDKAQGRPQGPGAVAVLGGAG